MHFLTMVANVIVGGIFVFHLLSLRPIKNIFAAFLKCETSLCSQTADGYAFSMVQYFHRQRWNWEYTTVIALSYLFT